MESQLQQVSVVVAEVQIQMGALESSMDSVVERRIEGAMESWREESHVQHNGLQKHMHEQSQQLWD